MPWSEKPLDIAGEGPNVRRFIHYLPLSPWIVTDQYILFTVRAQKNVTTGNK